MNVKKQKLLTNGRQIVSKGKIKVKDKKQLTGRASMFYGVIFEH